MLREQRITVVDEVFRTAEKPMDGIGQVARNLLHPFPARIDLNPGDFNSAGLDLHDEEHHVANRSEDPENLDAKEIAGIQRLPVHLHEPLPGSLLLALWGRLNSGIGQDVRDGGPSNFDLQSCSERIADLRVSPAQIGLGHLDNQLANVPILARSAALAACGAIVLSRAQAPKPGQDGCGRDQLAVLPALLRAQLFACKRQSTPLTGGKRDPRAARAGEHDLLQNPNSSCT